MCRPESLAEAPAPPAAAALALEGDCGADPDWLPPLFVPNPKTGAIWWIFHLYLYLCVDLCICAYGGEAHSLSLRVLWSTISLLARVDTMTALVHKGSKNTTRTPACFLLDSGCIIRTYRYVCMCSGMDWFVSDPSDYGLGPIYLSYVCIFG